MRSMFFISFVALCVLLPSAPAQERSAPVYPADPAVVGGAQKSLPPAPMPAGAMSLHSSGRVERSPIVQKTTPAVRSVAAGETAREGIFTGAPPKNTAKRSTSVTRERQGAVLPEDALRRGRAPN
jgi:hypothetical protein